MSRPKNSIRLFFVAALACASTYAAAQGQILKQVTADGKIVYTDNPIPNAKTEKKIAVDTSTRGSSTWSANQPGLKPGITGVRSAESLNIGVPGTALSLPPLPGSSLAQQVDQSAEKQKAEAAAAAKKDAEKQRQLQIEQAKLALDKAVAAKEEGKEPRPGERSATVSGGSRLNDKYHERQAELSQTAAEAQEAYEASRK